MSTLAVILLAGLGWAVIYWIFDLLEWVFDPVCHRIVHSRRRCYRIPRERRERLAELRALERAMDLPPYPFGPV